MNPYVRRLLDHSLFSPVDDFAACQGKRIRGSLLQWSYEISGGSGQISSAISEAIESLHAGSLVIDDVQDDSQSRRGQATMHQRIGVPLAINAGNWMYFRALECLSVAPLAPDQRLRLLESMVRAARQCHEGQALDLHARIDQIPVAHWNETTLAISTLKTGSLVELAVEMGCIASNANSLLSHVLPMFGRQIGVALQMRNDLDELARIAESDPQSAAFASIRDDDLRNARLTWPWVWVHELEGVQRCHTLRNRVVRSRGDRHDMARGLIELCGAHGDRVIQSLVRDQLRLLGEHVVDRRLLDPMAEILQPIKQACTRVETAGRLLAGTSLGTVP